MQQVNGKYVCTTCGRDYPNAEDIVYCKDCGADICDWCNEYGKAIELCEDCEVLQDQREFDVVDESNYDPYCGCDVFE